MKRVISPAMLVLLVSLAAMDCIGATPQLSDPLRKPQRIALTGKSIKRWFDVTLTDTGLGLKVTESWDTGTVVTTFLPYKDIYAVDHPSPLFGKGHAEPYTEIGVNCVHPIHQEIQGPPGTGIETLVDHFEGLSNHFFVKLPGSEAAETVYKYLTERRSGEITIDCSEDSRKSCLSFSEMLKAHDREIMDQITNPEDATYVCSRPEDSIRGDDSFFILYYDAPAEDRWYDAFPEGTKTVPKGTKMLMNNHLHIREYANGVSSDQFQIDARMKWINPHDSDHEDGHLAPVQDWTPPLWSLSGITKLDVSVSDAEISVAYSYRNQKSQAVAFSLQIRKATRRFVETLDSSPNVHFESSGTCGGFGLAAPR